LGPLVQLGPLALLNRQVPSLQLLLAVPRNPQALARQSHPSDPYSLLVPVAPSALWVQQALARQSHPSDPCSLLVPVAPSALWVQQAPQGRLHLWLPPLRSHRYRPLALVARQVPSLHQVLAVPPDRLALAPQSHPSDPCSLLVPVAPSDLWVQQGPQGRLHLSLPPRRSHRYRPSALVARQVRSLQQVLAVPRDRLAPPPQSHR
jgi:hypothetical protein